MLRLLQFSEAAVLDRTMRMDATKADRCLLHSYVLLVHVMSCDQLLIHATALRAPKVLAKRRPLEPIGK
jgi:hypothetical protein